jgi:ring-1,2-phenylacetyl-CoA epoxidase subunit PaaC
VARQADNAAALLTYVLRLGDNALVLGQQLSALVAHGPELEEELANANLALDYLGQARMFYSYAGELEGKSRTEDDFAFLRQESEYQSLLLLEQDNGHFGDTIVRQVLFDSYYLLLLEALVDCSDARLAEIAARAVKEIRYHLRHANHWLLRLGDGTAESHERVQKSLDDLWRYTGELFGGDEIDAVIHEAFAGPDLDALKVQWHADLGALLDEATLTMPPQQWMADGGRQGRHTERFGFLLAEMQHMQRSYPGVSW